MKRSLLLTLPLIFFLAAEGYSQERSITGTVTAQDNGSPVPGVNVILKGTTIGTVTDIDGKYRIQVPANGGTLVFSFIGLATEEVKIGAQSVIDMVMTADIKQLSEVVVTAMGLQQDKATLGYSVQNVNKDEVSNSLEPNIVEALSSKAAGVVVYSSSGSPGASSSIRIRGNTSISLTNSPLFVIDGVPIDNSGGDPGVDGVDVTNRAADINPNDIASITVLKGPAATVLYGIRAANGAIIMTTMKGKEGKPKVEFSSTTVGSRVNKLPVMNTRYAQGEPDNSGVPVWQGPETLEGFSWGPPISDLVFATNPALPGAPSAEAFTPEGKYLYDKNGYLVPKGTPGATGIPAKAYDNNDHFFVTGLSYDNNLSVTGGTEDVNYYMSAGYLKQAGVVPKTTWDRTTMLAKMTASLSKKFKAGMEANYINSGGYRVQRGSNLSGVMLGLLRNSPTFDLANGYTNGNKAAGDPSVYTLPDGTQRSYRHGIYDSPFWTINRNPARDAVNRLIGNVNLSYEVLNWITITYKLGIDTYHERDISAVDINSAIQPSSVTQSDGSSSDINSDLLLLINRDITPKLNLNATIGHNFFDSRGWGRGATGTTLGAPQFYHISNASNITAVESIYRKQIMGVFADLKFSWENYLFLNLSARNDWSSALPDKNNSFFYPAVSLGWTFTENLGLATNPIFSYGKLRASWGQVGRDAPVYATSNYFGQASIGGDGFISGIAFPAFGVNAFQRNLVLGNPDLKAELTTSVEFGGEFQFLRGRLGLDIAHYNSTTDNQVISLDLAPSTGYTGLVGNAGSIQNKGWEVTLNATPLKKGNFKWDININFTKYSTLVKKLDPRIGAGGIGLSGFVSTSARVIAGQPYSVIYGNYYKKVTSGPNKGKLIIGNDGWPIAAADLGPVGNPNPDWLAGVNNTLTWKGFTVGFLFDIRMGGMMWDGTKGIMDYWGTSKETADERNIRGYLFDGVVNTGTDASPNYVKNSTPVDFANPAFGVSSYKWTRYGFGFTGNEIESTSWVRLREVNVGYTFSPNLMNKIGFNNLTVSFVGRNLWLLTKYQGIDPETNLQGTNNGFGLEYFNMPNTKSYSINLKFGF